MAEAPIPNRADFLNRIIHVLGKGLQAWIFVEPTAGIEKPPYGLGVRFKTGHIVDFYDDSGLGVNADEGVGTKLLCSGCFKPTGEEEKDNGR